MDILEIIQKDVDKFISFELSNPLYGRNIFFYDGCVERNQLMGYLGAFCAFKKLNREIDYCIIPYETSQKLASGEEDEIVQELKNKIEYEDKETGSIRNTIPDTNIIPEEVLFTYIKEELLGMDKVKMQQFERINLPFSLTPKKVQKQIL